MLSTLTISIALLVIAKGQKPNVSIITQTGGNPVEEDTFELACYYNPACFMPLQWYFWNNTNLITTGYNVTTLGTTMSVNAACSNVFTNCNLTMTADIDTNAGPWICTCYTLQNTIVVEISQPPPPPPPPSVGKIVGIVVGSVAAIAVVVGVMVYIIKQKGSNKTKTITILVVAMEPNGEKEVAVIVKSAGPNVKQAGIVKVTWPNGKQSKASVVEETEPGGMDKGVLLVEGTLPNGNKSEATVVKIAQTAEGNVEANFEGSNQTALVVKGTTPDGKEAKALVVRATWPNGAKGDAVVIKGTQPNAVTILPLHASDTTPRVVERDTVIVQPTGSNQCLDNDPKPDYLV